MDMKITQLIQSLKRQGYGREKYQRITDPVKQQIYQAWIEKMESMSKRQFARYLEPLGFGRSTVKKILVQGQEIWETNNDSKVREWRRKENYGNRYLNVDRNKKLDECSNKQKKYIIKLRTKEPNLGYKRFYNKLLIPDEFAKYNQVWWDEVISKRLFYDILNEEDLPRRIKKSQKKSMIQKLREKGKLEWYYEKMKHVYLSERALHRWQVDIKYLTDIPNMVELGLFDIYCYQITFRDFRSWAVIAFYGSKRDVSRVMQATQIFEKLLTQVGIDLKKVTLQFDGWAEFSTYKINWNIWPYLQYVNQTFKWYKIIDRKEQNGHVEAYHRICEEDLFDTHLIKNLKWKFSREDRSKLLKTIHEYVKRHNKHWYSSYPPRYKVFKKRSPLQIIREDRGDKINHHILETYFGAYDVDCGFRMKKKKEYPLLINSLLNEKLNKSTTNLAGHFWAGLYINQTTFYYIFID